MDRSAQRGNTEKRPDTVPAIPLPFDVAIRAALETKPEPAERKPFGKRKPRQQPDETVDSPEND